MLYLSYHLSEIRKRGFYLGISWMSCFFISYLYKIELMYLISRPFLNFQTKFIFLDLTEALYTLLRICGGVSILCVIPYCLYQLWSFFIPSRYSFERIQMSLVLKFFTFLFVFEFMSIYSFIFPKVCEFLMGFEIKALEGVMSVELSARIQSYLSLLTRFFFLCLVFFQVPFLFLFMYRIQYLNCYQLSKNRKIFFALALLLSAFLSPPDIVSQLILTTFLVILYEFIIFLGFFFVEKENTVYT